MYINNVYLRLPIIKTYVKKLVLEVTEFIKRNVVIRFHV